MELDLINTLQEDTSAAYPQYKNGNERSKNNGNDSLPSLQWKWNSCQKCSQDVPWIPNDQNGVFHVSSTT